ncbi:hypothetical protein [Brenneria roseae]|uniref:hypothetical protein n=1 Tax=Brenneria roseae TaxID=1509241 RepID=UPI00109D9E61|nr:hypothetical protein [Brenneria roseae]
MAQIIGGANPVAYRRNNILLKKYYLLTYLLSDITRIDNSHTVRESDAERDKQPVNAGHSDDRPVRTISDGSKYELVGTAEIADNKSIISPCG